MFSKYLLQVSVQDNYYPNPLKGIKDQVSSLSIFHRPKPLKGIKDQVTFPSLITRQLLLSSY